MTLVRCDRCTNWWAMHTLHPEKFKFIGRICPNCVPVVGSRMGNA